MNIFQWLKLVVLSILLASTSAYAGESKMPTQILIKNVQVWDGASDGVTKKIDVLVEGNPLNDVSIMADWEKNLKVILKDGKIFKNTL